MPRHSSAGRVGHGPSVGAWENPPKCNYLPRYYEGGASIDTCKNVSVGRSGIDCEAKPVCRLAAETTYDRCITAGETSWEKMRLTE